MSLPRTFLFLTMSLVSSSLVPLTAVADVPTAASSEVEVLGVAQGTELTLVGSKVTGSHDIQLPVSSGTVSVQEGAVTGTQMNFDMTSLVSDNERLTGHLKSDDFFDIESHPTASFVSTSIERPSGRSGQVQVTGNLTIRGTTRSITFPARIRVAERGVQVSAEFTIDRQNWGISYPGMVDDLIRDDVLVRFDLSAGS